LGSFGSVTINNEVYNQFSLRPEFSIGKLGMGFDIYFYLDEDGNLYKGNWDFSSSSASIKTLIDKIYYVRWGNALDDLYFRIGALPKITLGQGILVKEYSNIIDYPHVRRTGFDFRYKFSNFGLNIVHSDLKEIGSPGVLAIRTDFEYIDNLDMGITLVTDINQKNGLIDTDDDGYPDYIDSHPEDDSYFHQNQEYIQELQNASNCIYQITCSNEIDNIIDAWYLDVNENDFILDEDNVSGISFDVKYTLNDNMYLYSEFAQLIGELDYGSLVDSQGLNSEDLNFEYDTKLGYGFIPIGLMADFGGFILNMDYRQNSERFIFNYWNENYDHNRVMVEDGLLITKESKLYNYGKQKGANVGMSANIANYINFSMDYQYMKGDLAAIQNGFCENLNEHDNESDCQSNSGNWIDKERLVYVEDNNNSFLAKIDIDTSKIPKVRIAELFYQQYNVKNPFKFEPNENTLTGYNIGVDMADNMVFILKGRTTYIPTGDGGYESVKTTQIETQILF